LHVHAKKVSFIIKYFDAFLGEESG